MNYDKGFAPISVALKNFREEVKKSGGKKVGICVERNKGNNVVYFLDVFADEKRRAENCRIAERIVKSILWVAGGYKIYICGDEAIFNAIKEDYRVGGKREFDVKFMERVYEHPFEVLFVAEKDFPKFSPNEVKIGGHLNGCRIGFDAGGSDRKVSAVIDGKTVYSEEVVWFPKQNSDWKYHYDGILSAMKTAKSKMPRVDAIGVSSAGVYVDNKIKVASLFVKVPDEDFKAHVENMYLDVAKEIGAPIEVANDGDVTALAGAMNLKDDSVLGIAMGTSEAGGYINEKGLLNGWLSELAFVPVDMNENAMEDEWSGDVGCGVKYFSQDAVIKLAELSGFEFDDGLSPAEKLKVIQKLMENGDERAKKIYEDIGEYLGYALPFYAEFYKIKHVLLLGRVTSGEGGKIVMDKANEILAEKFPHLKGMELSMPDESSKRVGQSIAAASLPTVE